MEITLHILEFDADLIRAAYLLFLRTKFHTVCTCKGVNITILHLSISWVGYVVHVHVLIRAGFTNKGYVNTYSCPTFMSHIFIWTSSD